LVKGYVHRVEIGCSSEVIARHQRSYERETAVYDPLQYLALLEHKSRALDQAAQLPGWELPECFAHWRHLLEASLRKQAARDSVTEGPRGGRRINYWNVARKLTNSEFVTMVANAWIGTTVPHSVVLEQAIEAVIQSGRTVTFAVKSELATRAPSEENDFESDDDSM
jgi:hypothetical protein